MMISFTTSGSTSRTMDALRKLQNPSTFNAGLEALGARGVAALSAATPVETALTANSWSYEIQTSGGQTKIVWLNSHNEGGVNVAIILQYGHGTGTGGYVAGRDYINPTMRPIFDEIANELRKKVSSV